MVEYFRLIHICRRRTTRLGTVALLTHIARPETGATCEYKVKFHVDKCTVHSPVVSLSMDGSCPRLGEVLTPQITANVAHRACRCLPMTLSRDHVRSAKPEERQRQRQYGCRRMSLRLFILIVTENTHLCLLSFHDNSAHNMFMLTKR